MIIGNGQIAQCFLPYDRDDTVFFASGVSNSNCTDLREFEREKSLLINTLKENREKKFVYFSSCALSAPLYMRNDYYDHKKKMENNIDKLSDNYFIFRVPQLFGSLKKHNTLINFLYHAVSNKKHFTVYDEAYRYVIELQDVREIVNAYINAETPNSILDIANPYRYKVTEVVSIFEYLLCTEANYDVVEKEDGYFLNLEKLRDFVEKNDLDVNFSRDYLLDKLKEKLLK